MLLCHRSRALGLGLCIGALLLTSRPGEASARTSAAKPFYLIAHMTNTVKAFRWAMKQGANAVEADLAFDSRARPNAFKHGSPCDCTLTGITSTSICRQLGGCNAWQKPSTLLSDMARYGRSLALVIIDSKVDKLPSGHLPVAGRNAVRLLDKYLFARGFRGNVIIGAPYIKTLPYLKAAVAQAKRSRYRSRYFFTIDGEAKNFRGVMQALRQIGTLRRVYGTGITAIAPGSYYGQIRRAAHNVKINALGLAYIWSIDSESSMRNYLKAGAGGIMTNRPGVLRRVLGRRALARPGTAIPVANRFPVDWEWVGTAPICKGTPSDCTKLGMRYKRSSNRGDGKTCTSGRKVLCTLTIR